MNSKIVYAILNWDRDYAPTLESLNLKEGTPLIICTNEDEEDSPRLENDEYIYIDARANIAKSKNKIIDFAKEEYKDYDYLFIIEDDVLVKDNIIFDKYIELMEKYELGLIFYGYDRVNKLFDVSNPGLIVTVSKDGEEAWFNRFPCTSVIGIDLKKNDARFNESLFMVEFDLYLQECADKKLIPYNGFYFDVPESYKYFDRIDGPTQRVKTRELMAMDKQTLATNKLAITIESNADALIQLLRKKNGYEEIKK